MNTFTKTIFLIGHHANLYRSLFIKTGIQIFSIQFYAANPFEDKSDYLEINTERFEFEKEYNLENLNEFFRDKFPYYWNELSSVMIIGDPSELICQSFLLIKNEFSILDTNYVDSVNLFIYPVGMVAMNIRKELAELMYDLKKQNASTYLIRKEEKDLSRIFSIILSTADVLSFTDLAEEIKGLEHLVHRKISAVQE